MNKEVKSIIQALATEQPDALKLLTLLPAVNYCDFSSATHRKRIIKEISHVKEIRIINNTNVAFAYQTAYITYFIFNDDWVFHSYPSFGWVSDEFMTDLVATCKSKNIQELLNFI